MNNRSSTVVKRQSIREARPLTKQATTVIKLDPAAILSLTIKQIILENPSQTNTYAHQIETDTLINLLHSTELHERLFAHICLFAIGKIETAEMFSELLLSYMQTLNDDEQHSQICLYFYKTAKFYLPTPVANDDKLKQEYTNHKSALKRGNDFFASDYKQNLEAACYTWLSDMLDNYDFVKPDVRILKIIVDQLTMVDAYSPLVDCMLGHLLARHQDTIPEQIVTQLRQQCHLARMEPANMARLMRVLMWAGNTLSRNGRLMYKHKMFELTSHSIKNKMYLEFPNTCVLDTASLLVQQPEIVIDCLLQLNPYFSYGNLSEMMAYSPELAVALQSSRNEEIMVLMIMLQRRIKSDPITRSLFQELLAICSERLRPMVINECFECYTWSFNLGYDADLHPLMRAAVHSQYLGQPECEGKLKTLESMRPVSYSEQVNVQYEAAKSAVVSYAAPVVDSLATSFSRLSSSLFSHGPAVAKEAEPDKAAQFKVSE